MACMEFPKEKTSLVAELELLGDRLIPCQIGVMEIIQQPAALTDHFEQTTAGTVVFDVFLQMFGQVIDSLGQKSDLHVSGPCVLFVQLEPCYHLSFFHIRISINVSNVKERLSFNEIYVKPFFSGFCWGE
jgi:hypothetical protein